MNAKNTHKQGRILEGGKNFSGWPEYIPLGYLQKNELIASQEKPERKVRDSKREFESKKEAATVEVKKEPEDEPRKKLKTGKGRSLTPSSTPNSSRTNSPAGTRTTRSPNKQVSSLFNAIFA